MKRLTAVLCLLALASWAEPPPPKPAKAGDTAKPGDAAKPGDTAKPAPMTPEERKKVLYALGVLVAQRTPLAQAGFNEQELDEVLKGFSDGTLGKPLKVTTADAMPKVDQLLRERQRMRGEAEAQKGQKYLAEQASAAGAKKTASGLVYIEEQAGTGAQPTAADKVKVNYRGTLVDGTEFDSSYKRGQPAEFPLGGVIKCWTEGVAMMKVGGKSKLICPSEIAYGPQGAPGAIPPNAVLTFEVELLDIVK